MLRTVNGRYWHDDTEISAEDYAELLTLATAKSKWVDDVFSGSASIEECPEEWREEVARRVEERRESIDPDPDIDDAEVYDILFGGAE